MQLPSLDQENPLEKCTATHSSIISWRIPWNKGVWWATVHRVAKSQIRLKQLSTHACLSSGRNPTLIIWLTQKILAVFNGEVIKTVV